jgi:hypothetical protein
MAIAAIDSVTFGPASVTAHTTGSVLTLGVPRYTLTLTDEGPATIFPPPSPTTALISH